MYKLIAKYSGGKYGFCDAYGKLIVPYVYQVIGEWHEGLIFVRRVEWCGFLDENGDERIDLSEYDLSPNEKPYFCGGLCEVKKSNGSSILYGYINTQGEIVIPIRYDSCRNNEKGEIFAARTDWKGVVTQEGEHANLQMYLHDPHDAIVKDGLIKVGEKGKYGIVRWGYINKSGDIKVPLIYEKIIGYSYQRIVAIRNDEYYLVKNTGEEIPIPQMVQMRTFCDGLCAVKEKNILLWGYLNVDGKYEIPPRFYDARDFNKGIAIVKYHQNYWGLINTSGVQINKQEYTNIRYFSEGLCAVCRNSQWGFIDETGQETIPLQFEEVGYFENGECEVKRGGMVLGNDNPWGRINKNGTFTKKMG